MKIRPTRKGGVAAAVTLAASGLVASALATAAPAAGASPGAAAAPAAAADQGAVAAKLADRLGSRTAGAYVDRTTRELVVTVTDAEAAQAVRAAGAVPRTVARGGDDLNRVMAALKRDATVPGTAWAVDPHDQPGRGLRRQHGRRAPKIAKIKAAAAQRRCAVRIEHVAGQVRKLSPAATRSTAAATAARSASTCAAAAPTTS